MPYSHAASEGSKRTAQPSPNLSREEKALLAENGVTYIMWSSKEYASINECTMLAWGEK